MNEPWRDSEGCLEARKLSERWTALAAWCRNEYEGIVSEMMEAKRLRNEVVIECQDEVRKIRQRMEKAEATTAATNAQLFEERERSILGSSGAEWVRTARLYDRGDRLISEQKLAAALAARSAQVTAFRIDAESRLNQAQKEHQLQIDALNERVNILEAQVRSSSRATFEERRKRIEAESTLNAAQSNFLDKRDTQSAEIDELKLRLQSEAYAGRQALKAELQGATDRLSNQRDQALIERDEALAKLAAARYSYHQNLIQADEHIVYLKSQLRRERNLRITLGKPKIPLASSSNTRNHHQAPPSANTSKQKKKTPTIKTMKKNKKQEEK